jgi:hypothetical protein
MKRAYLVFLSLLLLTLVSAGVASADAGEPMYGCPDRFELHKVDMNHMMDDMDHHHVGLALDKADMNCDSWICMKQVGVSQYNHVHIDNNVPLMP